MAKLLTSRDEIESFRKERRKRFMKLIFGWGSPNYDVNWWQPNLFEFWDGFGEGQTVRFGSELRPDYGLITGYSTGMGVEEFLGEVQETERGKRLSTMTLQEVVELEESEESSCTLDQLPLGALEFDNNSEKPKTYPKAFWEIEERQPEQLHDPYDDPSLEILKMARKRFLDYLHKKYGQEGIVLHADHILAFGRIVLLPEHLRLPK